MIDPAAIHRAPLAAALLAAALLSHTCGCGQVFVTGETTGAETTATGGSGTASTSSVAPGAGGGSQGPGGGSANGGSTGQGGAGQGGSASGGGGPVPLGRWRSWDFDPNLSGAPRVLDSVGAQHVTVTLYQSLALDDFGIDASLDSPVAGVHPQAFMNAEDFWMSKTLGPALPCVGKSTVDRGDDTGEANTPAPLGVRDLVMHPPFEDKYTVMWFPTPVAADYTLSDVAVRRSSSQGEEATFEVWIGGLTLITSVTATSDQDWVLDPQSHDLGALGKNARMLFVVKHDDTWGYDGMELSWTLSAW